MRRFFVLSLIVASGATGPRAQAELGSEFNPHHLSDTIVVTANRLATPTSQVGSSVTVITAQQIDQSQATMVTDVLRTVPGISVVQAGGPGQQASIFMRGANSEHVLIMIDGVEINDPSSPSNAVNLANLPVDNIERIEILRGPQSVLYGSDAIGGVIQILTRRPVGKTAVTFDSKAGSFQTYHERLAVTSGSEPVDFSVVLSRQDSDGISATDESDMSEKDGYNNTTLSGTLGVRPSRRFAVRLSGRATEAEANLDQQWGILDDPDYRLFSKEQSFSARVEHDVVDRRLWHQLGGYLTKYARSSSDSTDVAHPFDAGSSAYEGRRVKLDWQAVVRPLEQARLSVGVDGEEERLGQSIFLKSAYSDYRNDIDMVKATTTGLFAHADYTNPQWIALTLGYRRDDHEVFGGKSTYRTTLALLRHELGLKLRASFGTGMKVPALYQLYDPATGNPDLRCESSRGWEAGFELTSKGNRAELSMAYFHTNFNDLIQFDGTTWKMANIANARTTGFEARAGVNTDRVEADLSFTVTDAVDRGSDRPLLRRPQTQASLSSSYRITAPFSAGLEVIYTGERDDMDYDVWPARRVVLADYSVVNITGSYRVNRLLKVSARVDNLFDASYDQVYRFSSVPRSVLFGLALTL